MITIYVLEFYRGLSSARCFIRCTRRLLRRTSNPITLIDFHFYAKQYSALFGQYKPNAAVNDNFIIKNEMCI